MKHLAYLFAFLVLLTSVSATCYNQDNSPFCSKDDPLCEQSGDLDSDNDGWSDSCDAFADNEYLWVDYDGDNIGYGSDVYDCDDLDESILTYCGNTQLLNQEDNEDDEDNQTETEDEETSETFESLNSSSSTTSTSTSTRKGRSHHGNIIYVSDPNDNFQQQENFQLHRKKFE